MTAIPVSPDQLARDDEARRALESALPRVQEAAARWRTALTGLLGVAGTATFLAGPSTLSTLTEPVRTMAVALIMVAAVTVMFALVLVTMAGNPLAVSVTVGNNTIRRRVARARLAGRRLHDAQWLSYVAAVLILVGSLVALAGAISADDEVSVVVATTAASGEVNLECVTFTVDEAPMPVASSAVTPVETCPERSRAWTSSERWPVAFGLITVASLLIAWLAVSIRARKTGPFEKDKPLRWDRGHAVRRVIGWAGLIATVAALPLLATIAIRLDALALPGATVSGVVLVALVAGLVLGVALGRAYPLTSLWRPHPVARVRA